MPSTFLPLRLLPIAVVLSCAASTGLAQPVPYQDDLPMHEYLSMVEQVAPAAREGAEIYMAAFGDRCGRLIRVGELRAAFAEGAGDPVLMGMIRAAFAKDRAALTQLRASLTCPRS